LVLRDGGTGDGQRYTLLETIREYAALKLAAAGEAAMVGERHFQHFLQFAQALAPLLDGPAQLKSINALQREHDNLRVAQAWALAQSAVDQRLRLGAALGKFWRLHHHVQEGADYLLAALTGSEAQDSMLRADCCYWTGELVWRKGDEAPALVLLDEARTLYEALGNDIGLADVAYRVGAVAAARGDLETADRQFAEAAVLARKSSNSFMLLNCINAMGENARMRRDYLQARDCYEELLQQARQTENNRMVAFALLNQGLTSVPLGDSAAARRQLAQAYAIFCELGEKPMLPYVLEGLAGAAAGEGHSARAVSLYAATERLCAEIQFRLYQPDQQQHDLALQRLRQQLTAAQFESAWQAGLGLTLQQAMELGQAAPPP
jgi:non-specific serine/threonine protein kinase